MNTITSIKSCPYCAEEIKEDAIKCKHCGEMLNRAINSTSHTIQVVNQIENKQRKWSPGIAALLSFIIPGAGQMYKGHVLRGIFWFLFVVIGYVMFFIPGIFLHLICIISAASGDPYK